MLHYHTLSSLLFIVHRKRSPKVDNIHYTIYSNWQGQFLVVGPILKYGKKGSSNGTPVVNTVQI